uniref:EGF-like domain-containing protein n=1 Tax=Macrostomum lignano TaxID=282301 RepID=A0A1I8FQ61_9PLAT
AARALCGTAATTLPTRRCLHRRLADVRLSAGLRRRPLRAARSVPAQPVPSGQRMRRELHQLGLPVPLSVSGFVGDTCSIDVNECLSAPCANGGSCVNTEGGYSCRCPAGFEGRHCELPFCRPIDCRLNGGCYNGGVCSGDFDGKCRCVDGFSGTRCEVPPQSESVSDPCASNQPCLHGGLCRSFARHRHIRMRLRVRLVGPSLRAAAEPVHRIIVSWPRPLLADSSWRIQLPLSCGISRPILRAFYRSRPACRQSSRNPAIPAGAVLVSERRPLWLASNFRCASVDAVSPAVAAEIDVNECEQFGGACLNGGECVDEPGGFRCTCKPGF